MPSHESGTCPFRIAAGFDQARAAAHSHLKHQHFREARFRRTVRLLGFSIVTMWEGMKAPAITAPYDDDRRVAIPDRQVAPPMTTLKAGGVSDSPALS